MKKSLRGFFQFVRGKIVIGSGGKANEQGTGTLVQTIAAAKTLQPASGTSKQ
ncbi:hypothetical protein BN2475_420101 [Paraburkholderia ribeironis]|uniref:Uncharacterized protein n=1 Tax=Paraburkholderia ribeironis TaxID=1247936 RepID=A0A1N7S7W1_9BURK|nr:hypothetical protein [Paraburkholderia ribeironis]SIT43420.1 hypothetical protein BN2475_420101 [Paraburkholderia ribeironis]